MIIKQNREDKTKKLYKHYIKKFGLANELGNSEELYNQTLGNSENDVWHMYEFYGRNSPRGYIRKMLYILLEKCLEVKVMNLNTIITLEASGGVQYFNRRYAQKNLVELYKSIGFIQISNYDDYGVLMFGFVDNIIISLITWWNLNYDKELSVCKKQCLDEINTEKIVYSVNSVNFSYENVSIDINKVEDIKEYEDEYTRVYYFELKDDTPVYNMSIDFGRNYYYYVNKILHSVLDKFKKMNNSEKILIYIYNDSYEDQPFNNLCEMNGFTLLGYKNRNNSRLYGLIL